MTEGLENLGVIVGFFVLDVTYRHVLVRESGYLALDFSLFALLKAGFELVDDLRMGADVETLEVVKPLVALIFYTCLVILYTNLQRTQMHRIDGAFARFHEFLVECQEKEIAAAPHDARALMKHHREQRREVDAVKAMAEETIWINVFRARPRPRKLERATDLVALLRLVVAEAHVTPAHRIHPEDLYLERSWPTAAAAGGATTLAALAAIIPT